MGFLELLSGDQKILSQGAIFESLRRNSEVEFDENVFHAGLIYNQVYSEILEGFYRAYIDTAVKHGLPIAIGTATWRASQERISASSFADRPVNEDNVQFLKGIRDTYADSGITILIEGDIGPRGDAYKPEEALGAIEAQSFHSYQIEALASSGVDYLQASTFPAITEALGVAAAMSATRLPYVISFVVDKSGCLLDGTKLSDAVGQIDDEVGANDANFAINCVHPSVLKTALDRNPEIHGRVISFHANTSDLSVEELDDSDELITEDPDSFARVYGDLLAAHNIKIVGGCCGTNPDHIKAIADIL